MSDADMPETDAPHRTRLRGAAATPAATRPGCCWSGAAGSYPVRTPASRTGCPAC